MKIYEHLRLYLSHFFLEREIFRTKFVDNIKTYKSDVVLTVHRR